MVTVTAHAATCITASAIAGCQLPAPNDIAAKMLGMNERRSTVKAIRLNVRIGLRATSPTMANTTTAPATNRAVNTSGSIEVMGNLNGAGSESIIASAIR